MSTVFTGTLFNSLKDTLDEIIDDKTDGYASGLIMSKFMDEESMSDHYVDDLEMGGPGLASEKPEGTEIATGTIQEGILTRYIARTFALKLIITEEAIDDCKYPEVIDAARRLKRAMYKTVEFDAANILVRAANASYVGGDGQPLASTAHTLPDGGTFSNTMAIPMSPSRQGVIVMTTMIRKFPGHDGLPCDDYTGKDIVCPVDQWAAWSGILKSGQVPESNNNEINVVKTDLHLGVIPNVYWNTTTTNWGMTTTAPHGLTWKWRMKPKSSTWVENDNTTSKYAIRSRWSRGWSDARGFAFSNS